MSDDPHTVRFPHDHPSVLAAIEKQRAEIELRHASFQAIENKVRERATMWNAKAREANPGCAESLADECESILQFIHEQRHRQADAAVLDTLYWPPSALVAVEKQRAEIERLTAERDLALANADGVYAKLMPKIERLRTALTKIASRFEDYTYKGTLENSTREEALTALGIDEQNATRSEKTSEK